MRAHCALMTCCKRNIRNVRNMLFVRYACCAYYACYASVRRSEGRKISFPGIVQLLALVVTLSPSPQDGRPRFVLAKALG